MSSFVDEVVSKDVRDALVEYFADEASFIRSSPTGHFAVDGEIYPDDIVRIVLTAIRERALAESDEAIATWRRIIDEMLSTLPPLGE